MSPLSFSSTVTAFNDFMLSPYSFNNGVICFHVSALDCKSNAVFEPGKFCKLFLACGISYPYFMPSENLLVKLNSNTLDGFSADTPELAKAKETIQKLIETRSGKILMLGKNGTGKTHLAVCAVKAIGGAIYTMYEITIRIQASYGEKAEEREQKIVDELANLPLLAIDEIGRTKGSDAEERWLSYIIDKRNSRDLPLILISNKHTKKTCQAGGCKDCLENYISEDIMSRLCVGGKMLNYTGEDWRKKR